MASSKPTLNPLTDKPTNKTQITKPFMLAYMKSEKATAEDRAWFKKIVSDPANQKEQINQLTGEPYIDIDIPNAKGSSSPMLQVPTTAFSRFFFESPSISTLLLFTR